MADVTQRGVLPHSDRLRSLFAEAWEETPASTRRQLSWVKSVQQLSKQRPRSLYVLSDISDEHLVGDRLSWQEHVEDQLRYLLFVDDASADEIADLVIGLGIRSKERIVFVEGKDRKQSRSLLVRFLVGLASHDDDDDGRIIKAAIDDDELVVTSPTFKVLRVPLALLKSVRSVAMRKWKQFELDPYGEFLYWPEIDVHMGWTQLQSLVDPKARLRLDQKSAGFNKRYGAAIRDLRVAAGIPRTGVKGLSERTLRRVENGQTRATTNVLSKLAAAHGLDANEYLAVLAQRIGC